MPHPAKGYTSYLATGSNRSNGRRPHPDNTTHLATSSIHGEHRNDPCSSSTKHQGDLSWMPWKSVVLLAPRKVLLRSLALEALASEMARYRMRCLCGAKYRRCIGWRAQQESLTRIQMTWLRVAPGGSTFPALVLVATGRTSGHRLPRGPPFVHQTFNKIRPGYPHLGYGPPMPHGRPGLLRVASQPILTGQANLALQTFLLDAWPLAATRKHS